jgi:hypothetical protein
MIKRHIAIILFLQMVPVKKSGFPQLQLLQPGANYRVREVRLLARD